MVYVTMGILVSSLSLPFIFYMGKGVPPAEIASAMINCTKTVCTAQATSASCTQLNVATTSCLSSANVAVCLAGVPTLIGVGYADVVCLVSTLAKNPSKAIFAHEFSKSMDKSMEKSGGLEVFDIQENAAKWLKSQRVNVR